jgi:hypothetical protein
MKSNSRSIQVAVGEGSITYSPEITQKCYKKNTFLFFPAFSQVLLISFQNYCPTATTLKKIEDFKRYLKIIKDISSSSSGSSSVAVGSSLVAIGIGQKWTATGNYNLKSISYKKVAVVAVGFIQGQKIQFLPLFCNFLIVKKLLVAVSFIYKTFLFQIVIIDKKCNCYLRSGRGKHSLLSGRPLSSIGSAFPFNCQKNRLLLLIYYLLVIGFVGLMDKRSSNSVLGFYWGERGTWRIFSGCSGIIFIAHNYKKCDRQVLDSNKINKLQVVDIKKSVVQFGLDAGVLRSGTHPPIENSETLTLPSYLLLSINCKDFQRVFNKSIGQVFNQTGVFGFRKVGGAGGVR